MKKHYYLASAQLFYRRDKLERSKNFNAMIVSETPTVSRSQIGMVQKNVQVRFMTEIGKERTSEIVDVFIQGISYLGEMTEAEFHGEFDYPGKPVAEPEVVEEDAVPVEENFDNTEQQSLDEADKHE